MPTEIVGEYHVPLVVFIIIIIIIIIVVVVVIALVFVIVVVIIVVPVVVIVVIIWLLRSVIRDPKRRSVGNNPRCVLILRGQAKAGTRRLRA